MTSSAMVDYLSGDSYNTEGSIMGSEPTAAAAPAHLDLSPGSSLSQTQPSAAPSSISLNTDLHLKLSGDPVVHDKPPSSSQAAEHIPPVLWVSQPPGTVTPPSSWLNQGQQTSELQQTNSGNKVSGGSDSTIDNLVGQTQNLSLGSSAQPGEVKSEDAWFKDLIDFSPPPKRQ